MDAAAKPIACSDAATALNKAELLLRSPECTARPGALHGCLTRYGKLLAGLGPTGGLIFERDEMRCRTRALGSDLCSVAREYLASVPTDKGATSGTWHRYFAELVKKETTDKECARFDQFNKLGWKPYVFRWTERDGYEAFHQRSAFFADPEYQSRWAPAIERTDYGPPDRSVTVTVGLNATRFAKTQAGRLGRKQMLDRPFPPGSRFFQGGSRGWFEMPSALPDDSAASASLELLKAWGAPTHSGAPARQRWRLAVASGARLRPPQGGGFVGVRAARARGVMPERPVPPKRHWRSPRTSPRRLTGAPGASGLACSGGADRPISSCDPLPFAPLSGRCRWAPTSAPST